MMVSFYATFRSVVGHKRVDIPLPPEPSVQQLLDAVLEAYPELAPLLLDEHGALSRQVHLFINGRGVIHLPDQMETRLRASDHVDFFPAVAGG